MTAAKLRVTPSFYLFWAVFSLLDSEGVLPVFAGAALLHELGHVCAICACGGQVASVELSACGVVIEQRRPLGYLADCAVALAGPAAGMAAALAFAAAHCPTAAGANLLLSAFNCLPLLPLDGGCALAALLALLPPRAAEPAVRALAFVSLGGACALSLGGAALLLHTGRNATVLAAGLFLLGANRSWLHELTDYGMIITGKNHAVHPSEKKRWKQG